MNEKLKDKAVANTPMLNDDLMCDILSTNTLGGDCMNSRQISKISINGFKSIKESKIKLEQINILIGSNGAGKSNFISSFTMLHNVYMKNYNYM